VILRPSCSKDACGLTAALTFSITVSCEPFTGKYPHRLTRPGHAGAVVQARQLGDELYVGVHSDEAILENKGPTVMNLKER
jgi:hypothetical protein